MTSVKQSKTWRTLPLGDVANIERDSILPEEIGSGSTYIGLEHIASDGSFVAKPKVKNGDLASNKFRFNEAHILFGKLRPYLKKIARPDFCGVCSTDILPILPKQGVIDRDFLFHYLRQEQVVSLATARSTGANLPRISPSELARFLVTFPEEFDEQKRIAAILDKADAIRRKRQQVLQLADEFLRSVFLDMFGDPAANPKHWPLKQLVEVSSKFSDGPFGSNLKTSHYDCAGIRVVRLQNIGAGAFLDDNKAFISREHYESLPQHHCRPGDVLIGTLGEPNLRACILPDHIQEALNKADCVQLRPDTQKAEAEYLCSLLNCRSTLRMASSLILGQTRLRISMGRLRGLMVPVPPLAIQQRFSHLVRRLRNLRSCQESSDSQQKILFGSLVQRAFRGEL